MYKKLNPIFRIMILSIWLHGYVGSTAAKYLDDFILTGNWRLDLAKSERAESAPPQLRLTQTVDSVVIERTTVDNQSFIEKLSFDGKTCTSTTTSKRRKSGSAHWGDANRSFTETAVLSEVGNAEKVAFSVIEHWQLSANGKELILESTLTTANGLTFSSKAVYKRQ